MTNVTVRACARMAALAALFALAPSFALGAELGGQLTLGYFDEDVGDHVLPGLDIESLRRTQFSHEEGELHLMGDAAFVGLGGRIAVSGGLRGLTRFDGNPGTPRAAYWDTGTYLRLAYLLRSGGSTWLSATVFPFDAEPLRLGHLYPASVDQYREELRDGWINAPGLRLALDSPRFGLSVGWKGRSAMGVVDESREGERQVIESAETELRWALLSGVRASVFGQRLQLEAQVGYYHDGALPWRNESHTSVGFSGRVVFRRGLPIDEPVDTALQRRNPNALGLALRRRSWPSREVGYLFSIEGLALRRHAHLSNDSKDEYAVPGSVAAQARIGVSSWLIESTLIWANLPFLVYTVPELTRTTGFLSLPDLERRGELLWLVSAERSFARAHLTPGISVGVDRPASVRARFATTTPGDLPSVISDSVVVHRETGETTSLPANESPRPIVRARAQLRFDLPYASVLGWFEYRRDPNAVHYVATSSTSGYRSMVGRDQYGAGVAVSVSSGP